MTSTHANHRRIRPESHVEGARHISVRDLQSELGQLRRDLAAGVAYVLTDRGMPVGKITGLNEIRVLPAQNSGGWEDFDIDPPRSGPSVMEIVDELREDRL